MSGSWMVPVAIVLAFSVLVLIPFAEVLLSPVRRTSFDCPWAEKEVLVKLVRRSAFGIVEPVDVWSCSAFRDPEKPTCGKECLLHLS